MSFEVGGEFFVEGGPGDGFSDVGVEAVEEGVAVFDEVVEREKGVAKLEFGAVAGLAGEEGRPGVPGTELDGVNEEAVIEEEFFRSVVVEADEAVDPVGGLAGEEHEGDHGAGVRSAEGEPMGVGVECEGVEDGGAEVFELGFAVLVGLLKKGPDFVHFPCAGTLQERG